MAQRAHGRENRLFPAPDTGVADRRFGTGAQVRRRRQSERMGEDYEKRRRGRRSLGNEIQTAPLLDGTERVRERTEALIRETETAPAFLVRRPHRKFRRPHSIESRYEGRFGILRTPDSRQQGALPHLFGRKGRHRNETRLTRRMARQSEELANRRQEEVVRRFRGRESEMAPRFGDAFRKHFSGTPLEVQEGIVGSDYAFTPIADYGA